MEGRNKWKEDEGMLKERRKEVISGKRRQEGKNEGVEGRKERISERNEGRKGWNAEGRKERSNGEEQRQEGKMKE